MYVIYHHAPIERTSRYSIEGRCEGLQHVAVLDRQRVGTPGWSIRCNQYEQHRTASSLRQYEQPRYGRSFPNGWAVGRATGLGQVCSTQALAHLQVLIEAMSASPHHRPPPPRCWSSSGHHRTCPARSEWVSEWLNEGTGRLQERWYGLQAMQAVIVRPSDWAAASTGSSRSTAGFSTPSRIPQRSSYRRVAAYAWRLSTCGCCDWPSHKMIMIILMTSMMMMLSKIMMVMIIIVIVIVRIMIVVMMMMIVIQEVWMTWFSDQRTSTITNIMIFPRWEHLMHLHDEVLMVDNDDDTVDHDDGDEDESITIIKIIKYQWYPWWWWWW